MVCKHGQPPRALVIADGTPAERVADCLAAIGFEVNQVADCSQALGTMKADRPQLVVIDFRLPGAYLTCRRFNTTCKYRHRHPLLLVLEGGLADIHWVLLLSLHVDGYLPAQATAHEMSAKIINRLRHTDVMQLLEPDTILVGHA